MSFFNCKNSLNDLYSVYFGLQAESHYRLVSPLKNNLPEGTLCENDRWHIRPLEVDEIVLIVGSQREMLGAVCPGTNLYAGKKYKLILTIDVWFFCEDSSHFIMHLLYNALEDIKLRHVF